FRPAARHPSVASIASDGGLPAMSSGIDATSGASRLAEILSENMNKAYETAPIEGYNYLEYITVEKKYLQSRRSAQDRTYWLNHFNFIVPSKERGELNHPESNRLVFSVEGGQTKQLHEWVRREQLSLNTLFNAVAGLYFYLKKGARDQVIA